jgi:hypothetical protein
VEEEVSKTKHTPEPWYVVADDGSDFTCISTRPELPEGETIDMDHEVLGSSEWLRVSGEDLDRVVECVNALTGVEDPASFVAKAKRLMEEKSI